MRRLVATIVLFAAGGCSTAPVADLLDCVAPGNGGGLFHRRPAPSREQEYQGDREGPEKGDPFLGIAGPGS